MKFCQHGSNFRWKFEAVLEYASRDSDKNTPVPPLKGDEHNMSIGNLISCVNSVTFSCFVCYDSLLQNVAATLLQNATEVYYKMRQIF